MAYAPAGTTLEVAPVAGLAVAVRNSTVGSSGTRYDLDVTYDGTEMRDVQALDLVFKNGERSTVIPLLVRRQQDGEYRVTPETVLLHDTDTTIEFWIAGGSLEARHRDCTHVIVDGRPCTIMERRVSAWLTQVKCRVPEIARPRARGSVELTVEGDRIVRLPFDVAKTP